MSIQRRKPAVEPKKPVVQMPVSDLYTPDEAAQYLKMSRQTLRRFTAAGRISFHRYSSQILRYRKSALDAFLASVEVAA